MDKSLIVGNSACLILGDMERHAHWFQLVAVVLVVVGLVTLVAPAPAHAMDPQLILALASAAGAVALVVGYLIVANNRESKRAASLEGVYACTNSEASGPMGCVGPSKPSSMAAITGPESPMAADGAPSAESRAFLGTACPGGRVAGPMGCDGSMHAEPAYSASASSSSPAASPVAIQAQ